MGGRSQRGQVLHLCPCLARPAAYAHIVSLARRHLQVQRAIKRQRSLAAGELPPFGPGGDMQQLHQHPLQQQPSGSLDFLPKCTGVLNRVYMACNTIQPMFGLHAKDVFYRPVRETFPNIAADYYARISHPMTFRTIEERISKGFYVNAQMFADVSGHGGAGSMSLLAAAVAVGGEGRTLGEGRTACQGCWSSIPVTSSCVGRSAVASPYRAKLDVHTRAPDQQPTPRCPTPPLLCVRLLCCAAAPLLLQDMRLVFDNCKKYNPLAADPVRLASLKLSEVFENCWVSSGLCAEVQRAKRATAGIAAPKFEPEEYDGVGVGGVPRKTGSHHGAEQPGMQVG